MNDSPDGNPFGADEQLPSHYALIYAPRRKRERFPFNTVELVVSEAAAIAAADPEAKRHPAEVRGPFRSSEGVQLYYLVRWLD